MRIEALRLSPQISATLTKIKSLQVYKTFTRPQKYFLSYSLNLIIIMTIPSAEPKQTAVLKWGYQSNATVEKTKRLYP
jgi:hypothetical protein